MNQPVQIAKEDSWKLFDQIAGTYDLLNGLISLGVDRFWRKQMAQKVVKGSQMKALDLATGTADVALRLAELECIEQVQGVDLSQEMIALGNKKVEKHPLGAKVSLVIGDGVRLAYPDNTFDLVTLAFGIRNFSDPSLSLAHIHRVLRPQGQVLIMEFGLPKNSWIKRAYLFYFRKILPLVGRLISKHPFAYSYLNRTVESFPYGREFVQLLESVGFKDIVAYPLLGGISYIYSGRK